MMKYPIGVQSFEKIREDGFAYVDKTDLIYRLTHEGNIYFLSRPRRFGKSLLVSTRCSISTSTAAISLRREPWMR